MCQISFCQGCSVSPPFSFPAFYWQTDLAMVLKLTSAIISLQGQQVLRRYWNSTAAISLCRFLSEMLSPPPLCSLIIFELFLLLLFSSTGWRLQLFETAPKKPNMFSSILWSLTISVISYWGLTDAWSPVDLGFCPSPGTTALRLTLVRRL